MNRAAWLLARRRILRAFPVATFTALVIVSVALTAVVAVTMALGAQHERRVERLADYGEVVYYVDDGRPLTILAPLSQHSGLEPGSMLVSPGLEQALGSHATVQAHLPFRAVGAVATEVMLGPDELVAVLGAADPGYRPVGEPPASGSGMGASAVFVLILLPGVLLIGAALRSDGRAREARLVALRIIGAGERTLRATAAWEVALTAVPAVVASWAVWMMIRPLVAQVTVGGVSFFTADVPLVLPAVISAAFTAAVGTTAAWMTVRRSRKALPARRVFALMVPVGALLFLIGTVLARSLPEVLLGAAELVGLAMVLVGIAAGGHMAVGLAARRLVASRSGPRLLAVRRLQRDPEGGFRAVAGLALLAFVFGFASSLNVVPPAENSDLVEIAAGDRSYADILAAVPDVNALAPLALGGVPVPDGIVTTCAGVAVYTSLDIDCEPGNLYGSAMQGTILVESTGVTPAGDRRSQSFRAEPWAGPWSMTHARAGTAVNYVAVVEADEASSWPISQLVVVPGAAELNTRRALATEFPLLPVGTASEFRNTPLATATTSVALGFVFSFAALAGLASLLVAAGSLSAERRRVFAALRAIGMGRNGVERVALWQLAIPIAVAVLPAMTLGVILAFTGARALDGDAVIPWMAVLRAAILAAAAIAVGAWLLARRTGRHFKLGELADDT